MVEIVQSVYQGKQGIKYKSFQSPDKTLYCITINTKEKLYWDL